MFIELLPSNRSLIYTANGTLPDFSDKTPISQLAATYRQLNFTTGISVCTVLCVLKPYALVRGCRRGYCSVGPIDRCLLPFIFNHNLHMNSAQDVDISHLSKKQ